MNSTKISWTDFSWNPIIGCHKISLGCDNCYAERMANRIAHMNNYAGEMYRNVIGLDGKWNWETHLADSHMDFPRTLKKPRKIFVGSMTDLFFHSQTAEGRVDITRLFSVFAQNPKHIFQILTKRPIEMKLFLNALKDISESKVISDYSWKWPLPNVWLGVTVCNQEEADFKIPILLDTPAAKRFVSCEPLLSSIHIPVGTKKIDQLIVGGETGPGARLLKEEWVHDLWEQAIDQGICFFFKSWGKLNASNRIIESFKQFPI